MNLKTIKLAILVSFPLVESFTINEMAIKDILFDSFEFRTRKQYNDIDAYLKKHYDYLHYSKKSDFLLVNPHFNTAISFRKSITYKINRSYKRLLNVVYTDKLDDLPDLSDFCRSEFINTSSIEILHDNTTPPRTMLPTPAILSYLQNSSSSSSSSSSLPTSSSSIPAPPLLS